MKQDGEPPSLGDFDARLRELRSRSKKHAETAEEQGTGGRSVGGAGVQVGVEMLGGVIGGLIIGYGLDYWLGTAPVLLIVLFFLGSAAGMLNAYRHIMRAGQEPEPPGPKRNG